MQHWKFESEKGKDSCDDDRVSCHFQLTIGCHLFDVQAEKNVGVLKKIGYIFELHLFFAVL